jgi:very-short-patch-repair endonuclease
MTTEAQIKPSEEMEENLGELEIVSSIVERVTFASHQNDVAIIADLLVKNSHNEGFENLELSLECEPALIASKVWKIDRLSANGEIRIRDRAVSLAGGMLSNLNERLRGEIKLALLQDGQILSEKRHKITGLAKHEWGGASYMPELLAAFVMPNDPAVSNLLKQAGEVLRRAGEQPALDGYQSRSRERVWKIASSIWATVSARRLVYAEPPASFELEGQKIRTPSEVWNDGLATCLDTTVLFAAALEQAGLNPIIAFTKGHALCGVWLQPQQLPSLTTDDCADLRKYVALKELILFETTLAINEPPVAFSKAIAEGNRRISEENEEQFVYALDIKRARRQQITPLGSIEKVSTLATDQDGQIVIALEAAPALPGFDLGLDDSPPPETPETRLDSWKRKLLDLTKRNRLLNLKPSKTAIRLHCSDSAILEDRLAEGKKITVIPMAKLSGDKNERDNLLFINRTGEDFTKKFIEDALERDEIVSDMAQADLDAGMVELYRKAKTDLQEGGANTLYLALGILKWKQSESEERSYRAPLILLPVKLERKSAASRVKIAQHEDGAVFNMTLLEMLRQDFDLRLPELEGELPKDHSGIDVPLVLEIVKKAVRDISGFEVVEEIVLSTFSFAKYLMWKDLADRTEILKQNSLVRHLIDKPRDPYSNSASFMRAEQIDEKTNPAELFMPLSADSSQVVAIHASASGGDFILEGPPGTGKSQTIGNIIAHNLGLGRKVLFVSEKMAALEVVYGRLKEKGLGDFCLELHSNKANKRHVLDQLGQSWHNRNEQKQLEWNQEAERLTAIRNDLNTLVKALHAPGVTGVSPRKAIGRAARWQNTHRFRLDWSGGLEADAAVNEAGLSRLKQIAKRLGQIYGELNSEDRIAFVDITQADWSNAWQSRLVNVSASLAKAVDDLLLSSSKFCKECGFGESPIEFSKLKGLISIAKAIPKAATYNLEYCLGPDYSAIFASLETALAKTADYKSAKSTLSCAYADTKIPEAPVADWQEQWTKSDSAIWPMSPIQSWALRGKVKKHLSLSMTPDLELDLPVLLQLQILKREMDEAAAQLPSSVDWRGLDTNVEKIRDGLEGAKSIREGMARIATDIQQLPEVRAAVRRLVVDGRELLQPGMPITDLSVSFIQDMERFLLALSAFKTEAANDNATLDNVLDFQNKARKIVELQPRINAWCQWKAACREAESAQLKSFKLALEEGIVDPIFSEGEFETGYAVWLAERLIDDRQELRTFSALAHEDKILAFRKLDAKISDLSIDYIRAKLSGGIPDPDAQQRPAGYGILSRELQKKMKHKPVRELVAEMGDCLTALTPCLLMSPLSVSQFLSADNQLFDLVVFDEASQITVWDSIGAIARGKNVIIVGDPKQMPPTTFFDRAASEEDEDEGSVEDLESILDEALAASVKLHRLTGHYRSRHESLIAFSNHRYYKGDLVTYPSSDTKQSAVSLIQVPGIYQRGRGRTNPEEAKAVVAEVVRRLVDPELSKLSIGVVALNSEQQRLIDDLLDQERRKNSDLEKFFHDDHVEPVFIKNLETVQGDQRDVILLSIGYGPDTPGAKTMSMNFGPLNRKGGERRLNVAITRATSEMVVFSSFDPSLIDLTRTSSQAVRDLKHYLEFAQRGPVALGEAVLNVGGTDAFDSDFEESIAEGLRNKGWTVHTQIGVSKFRIDLGIVHPDYPGKYMAGVECDGATYHSSPSARDRDRVRHNILENLGWKLIRIWSTDYWIDPVRTIDIANERLKKLLEESRAKIAQSVPNIASTASVIDINILPPVDPESETIGSEIEDFETELSEDAEVVVESGNLSGILPSAVIDMLAAKRFYEREYLPVIELIGMKLVNELGPITFRHVSTKIARAHNFQRTGSQIKKQVWAAISKKCQITKSENGETVFWPEKIEPNEVISFRGMEIKGEKRDWRDVPYPEKLGLAVSTIESGVEDPVNAIAVQIGLGRLRQVTKEEIEKLLDDAKR